MSATVVRLKTKKSLMSETSEGLFLVLSFLSNLSHLSNAAATAVTWASLLRCEAAAATWEGEGEWRVVLGRVLRELEAIEDGITAKSVVVVVLDRKPTAKTKTQ